MGIIAAFNSFTSGVCIGAVGITITICYMLRESEWFCGVIKAMMNNDNSKKD